MLAAWLGPKRLKGHLEVEAQSTRGFESWRSRLKVLGEMLEKPCSEAAAGT